jgi:hypothetical protein
VHKLKHINGESTSISHGTCLTISNLGAQDIVPLMIIQILEQLEKETGLVSTILLGGPEPQCGGKIVVMTFHSGKM